MRRPRWHDVLITLAILGVAAAGAWAFWGQELRPAPPAPALPLPPSAS